MKPTLNRKLHQQITRYDFQTMYRFVNNLYLQGFKDGQEEAGGLTAAEVEKVLLSVPGIGKLRAAMILEALNVKMDDEQEITWKCENCGADLTQHKGVPHCPFCTAELTWG